MQIKSKLLQIVLHELNRWKNKIFQSTSLFFSYNIEEKDDSTNQAPSVDLNYALLKVASNNSHPI